MKLLHILMIILFILSFNCFIKPIKALNFEYYGIEGFIQEDKSFFVSINLYSKSSIPDFQYKFRNKVYDLQFFSEFAPVRCKTYVTDITIINCTFSDYEKYNEMRLKINFSVKDLVKRLDGSYELGYFLPMEDDVKRFSNIIYLPPTATLATEISNESFSPRDGIPITDGKHIMIYWERINVTRGDDIYFSVNYRMPQHQNDNFLSIIFVALATLITIAGIGVFYLRSIRKEESLKVIMPLMKKDEKIVIDIINKHGGTVNQKVIVRESDFSKAKVSRIIADLKERGIVEVESMGRTNKVTLKIKK